MMNRSACLVVSMLALAACSDSGSTPIASSALSGTVGGQPWSFQVGSTDPFLSDGETDFFAILYPSTYTPCGFSEPGGPHLIVAVPKQPGDYNMDLSRNMTFVDNTDNNLIATNGRIVIDAVTATSVTGGLHGKYDGANEVNGQFQLTICAK